MINGRKWCDEPCSENMALLVVKALPYSRADLDRPLQELPGINRKVRTRKIY